MKLIPQKLEGWGYCTVKMILTSTVSDWPTSVTDGQTEFGWHSALSICAVGR